MEVLRETLNLIIAALPTTVIVFLFYLFARAAFFKPMMHVLEERAARTEGARADAARLDSQAQEKLAIYHRAIDKIRAEIFTDQEAARHAALEQRAELLRQTRANANERVRQEKLRLEKELAATANQVDRESQRLAEQAARAVLADAAPVGETSGEA